MDLLKLLNINEIIAQIVSFLLLLFLLRVFAWKRLLKFLDARKERIANEFKQIEDTKQELASLKSDFQAKLTSIDELAAQKIQEAVSEGRKVTDEMRKKAHEQAQDIIENAQQNIRYELGKAKEELKDKIIDLTISATENIIQEKFTEKDDKKIIQEFLDKIDKVK